MTGHFCFKITMNWARAFLVEAALGVSPPVFLNSNVDSNHDIGSLFHFFDLLFSLEQLWWLNLWDWLTGSCTYTLSNNSFLAGRLFLALASAATTMRAAVIVLALGEKGGGQRREQWLNWHAEQLVGDDRSWLLPNRGELSPKYLFLHNLSKPTIFIKIILSFEFDSDHNPYKPWTCTVYLGPCIPCTHYTSVRVYLVNRKP